MSYPNCLGINQDIFNDGHDINISNNVYFNSIGPNNILTTSSSNELTGITLNPLVVAVTNSSGALTSSSTSTTQLSYLNNVTSDIQAQINNIEGAGLNHNIVPVTNSSGNLISSTVSATTLGYLDATSSVQTQLNGKQASLSGLTSGDFIKATGTGTIGNSSVLSESGTVVTAVGSVTIQPATNTSGTLIVSNSSGNSLLDVNTVANNTTNRGELILTPYSADGVVLQIYNESGTGVLNFNTTGGVLTTQELNASNLTASRVLVSDGSQNITSSSVSSTTLGYLDATSSVQTQLNGKQASLSGLTSGAIIKATGSGSIGNSSFISENVAEVTVSGEIVFQQTALFGGGLNKFQPSSDGSILQVANSAGSSTVLNVNTSTGVTTASELNATNLTASRVLVSDGSQNITSSSVTSTTLGYLDATSSVQTQLNGKQATIALNNNIVPVTNGSGALTSSTVTATTLGYLDATSSVQTQLNGKQASLSGLTSGDYIKATGTGTVGNASVLSESGTALTATGTVLVKPGTNSTTAWQLQNSSGTAIFTMDNSTPQINSASNIFPSTNNTYNLGSGSYRWLGVYAYTLNASATSNLASIQPVSDNSYYSGTSSLRWSNVYTATQNIKPGTDGTVLTVQNSGATVTPLTINTATSAPVMALVQTATSTNPPITIGGVGLNGGTNDGGAMSMMLNYNASGNRQLMIGDKANLGTSSNLLRISQNGSLDTVSGTGTGSALVVNYGIIPSANNTMALGTTSAQFSNMVTNQLTFGGGTAYFNLNGGVNLVLNGSDMICSLNCRPLTDNSTTCGTSGNRWAYVYAAGGVLTTSDVNTKTNIASLPSSLGLTFINALQPKSWNWISGSNTTNTNYGLVYQDVVDVISSQSLGNINLVEAPQTTTNADGTTSTSCAAMNYQQLLGPMILAIQQLSAQVTALQAQVAALHS